MLMADLIQSVANKARDLFEHQGLYCAEAVLLAVNQGLKTGVDPTILRGVAMGFGHGLGGAGCLCGSLAGAVMAVSLALSGHIPPDKVRRACGEVHERFRQGAGASCCRVLTKPFKDHKAKRFHHCSGLTAKGAQIAMEVILEKVPALAKGVDLAKLARKPSRLARWVRRLAERLGPE